MEQTADCCWMRRFAMHFRCPINQPSIRWKMCEAASRECRKVRAQPDIALALVIDLFPRIPGTAATDHSRERLSYRPVRHFLQPISTQTGHPNRRHSPVNHSPFRSCVDRLRRAAASGGRLALRGQVRPRDGSRPTPGKIPRRWVPALAPPEPPRASVSCRAAASRRLRDTARQHSGRNGRPRAAALR